MAVAVANERDWAHDSREKNLYGPKSIYLDSIPLSQRPNC